MLLDVSMMWAEANAQLFAQYQSLLHREVCGSPSMSFCKSESNAFNTSEVALFPSEFPKYSKSLGAVPRLGLELR